MLMFDLFVWLIGLSSNTISQFLYSKLQCFEYCYWACVHTSPPQLILPFNNLDPFEVIDMYFQPLESFLCYPITQC